MLTSYASFILIGWNGLFIPSLLRVLQSTFDQPDASFGLVYLVSALLFAAGALSSGLIAGRVGRHVVLPAGSLLIGGGYLVEGIAPSWAVFLAGAGIAGAGAGAIDAVVSSVIMDLSTAGSGNRLNRLHLFYSIGALAAPLVIGPLVGIGLDWRLLALATAVAGLALAAPLARVGRVPPRARSSVAVEDGSRAAEDPSRAAADARRAAVISSALRLALATLAIAIACYVAAEAGVSSWLVGFLGDEPMTVATVGLGLFWVGLAIGRLVASRIADRFDPVRFTVTCALAGGIAILAAVAGSSGSVRIPLFFAAGLAFGPVYPMIVAVAGSLFPYRAAAVAGILAAAGPVGAILYPWAMGLIAGVAGLGAGMAGAALLIFASGAAVVVAGRLAGPEPVPREGEPVALADGA